MRPVRNVLALVAITVVAVLGGAVRWMERKVLG
jgi:hypothetical protein